MSIENEQCDCKSLKAIRGKTAVWEETAKDCVCFANGQGGKLLFGIEDDEALPPADQQVEVALLERLRKRIGELTVNVQVLPHIITAENGGQYVELTIARSVGVASTSDGRYYLRVADTCQPVVGDDVLRLANERPGHPWEAMTLPGLSRDHLDSSKIKAFVSAIRASNRVKIFVKEKSAVELLDHYHLAAGQDLTHLGILLLGSATHRARLGTSPVVQFLKFDEHDQKVNKLVWDDYSLSPVELVDAVWHEVADFRESYELPEGMFRRTIPAFDEKVVRELLVNALVHRPYTQRGDIFLNLYPDRLEVVNPGRLPLGVTPHNILHASRRRNDGLARVFHDLELMEREGSGFDLIYDRMLSSGRPAPVTVEENDAVRVTIQRRMGHPQVIRLIAEADRRFHLRQRERISLGILAQSEGMTAREFAKQLELTDITDTKNWLGRLLDLGLVHSSGRTQATRYFLNPALLRDTDLSMGTTLTRIEPHRLEALIIEDLCRYPGSAISEIHNRVAPEIKQRRLKTALDHLVKEGKVRPKGEKRWRRYWFEAQ
ncbi:MAG: putative DNA binding domain-containing protein [Desulfobulbaceae bacterium]|uniref:Putative DNA binding domain-containing protein n=1 Tax=Candidatus Desulfobia pelagia TaxID=2841692 RepID=A0A8J6TAU7_9BACT|nr:putative DNA binding domain-containing protein [Candidatus Desulfobia pelagia]